MKMSVALAVCCVFCMPATAQTFKQHKIGETAQEFFSIATFSGSDTRARTTEYCAGKVNALDVQGCTEVQDALHGKDTKVGARYAAEIGKGSATFHGSKLVMMLFLVEHARFDDVITDITNEIGGTQPVLTADTMQNAFGAKLQARQAVWNSETLRIEAKEAKTFDRDLGIAVMVADSDYLKHKEAERQDSRPNTIR
jgi:hypothetical protein